MFLDACCIACWADVMEDSLQELEVAIKKFHTHCKIFHTSGVHPTNFNLPHQHSLVHLTKQIQEFGAPGGLCLSITESHHITAVKRPWGQSNWYESLAKCCSPTNASMNSSVLVLILLHMACYLWLTCHLQNWFSFLMMRLTMGMWEWLMSTGNVTLARTRGTC